MKVILDNWDAVSIANFMDKQEWENEDYVNVREKSDENYIQWVVCDGAGGAGVFCREWASFLGNNLPLSPALINREEKNVWLDDVSTLFHDEVIARKDLSDLILQKKIYQTGSYSTMCACWIDKQSPEIFFSVVGDSSVFFYEREGENFILRFFGGINDQKDMDEFPELVNWNIESHSVLPFNSMALNGEFIIFMASDTLAKWMILTLDRFAFQEDTDWLSTHLRASLEGKKYTRQKDNINAGSNISSLQNLMEYLQKISAGQDIFREEMQALFSRQEIELDDYSLILINGHVS